MMCRSWRMMGFATSGFFPDQAPFLNGKALPLSGQDLRALTSLILNFCLGYIPTEVAAFKGEEDGSREQDKA
jgi:hypothetical protein